MKYILLKKMQYDDSKLVLIFLKFQNMFYTQKYFLISVFGSAALYSKMLDLGLLKNKAAIFLFLFVAPAGVLQPFWALS